MEVVALDFETYYDREYTLSKLTTEEYIRDPRFEVIMLGVRWPDSSKEVVSGTHLEIKQWCDAVPWGQYAILCHNTIFDGAILAWKFGVKPRAWLDTLSMARAMFSARNNSLASLAKRYHLEDKGTYVMNMLGRRCSDMSPGEFRQYSKYCLHDVDLCYDLWGLMSTGWYNPTEADFRGPFPIEELMLIDLHIRMFTEPMLKLNRDKLEAHLAAVRERKAELLSAAGVEVDLLMSNQKFAEVLKGFGVDPPTKISATTGKPAFAFAKTDPGMKELLDHEDERVQAVAAARLGVKSTLEETRTERFIGISKRGDTFPVPLKYAYARTKRSSGGDGINLQNLPSRGNTNLKSCIEAPPGYVIIDCDSSAIEARVLAWLAGQEDLVNDFANGVDVYCKLASKIYGKPVTKADKLERFVGKTVTLGCFGPNTQVLTDSGWKSIVQVSLTDKLWDGEKWVTHSGLLNQGFRWTETSTDLGLTATGDHEILTEHGWREWSEVHSNRSLFRSALSRATLPSSSGRSTLTQRAKASAGIRKSGVYVVGKVLRTAVISSIKRLNGVGTVLASSLLKLVNGTGATPILSQMMHTESACSTAYLHALTGVRYRLATNMRTTAGAAFVSTNLGEKTVGLSYDTSLAWTGGTSRSTSWIELTTKKVTSLTTYVLCRVVKTYGIGVQLENSNKKSNVLKQRMQTYDIALAGPRNRFTVLTNQGPIIVHNCGYQTGAGKLKATLKAATLSVDLDIVECEKIINTYRGSVPHIVDLWARGEESIRSMYNDESMWLGREGVALIEGKKGIKLPSGLYISYPQLHRAQGERFIEWRYKDDTGIVNIYGGKLIENLTQALARIIVMSQMLRISRKLPVKLTVHDSVIALAREDERQAARAYIESCMRWVPDWAQGCPLNCESKWGYNYGELHED